MRSRPQLLFPNPTSYPTHTKCTPLHARHYVGKRVCASAHAHTTQHNRRKTQETRIGNYKHKTREHLVRTPRAPQSSPRHLSLRPRVEKVCRLSWAQCGKEQGTFTELTDPNRGLPNLPTHTPTHTHTWQPQAAWEAMEGKTQAVGGETKTLKRAGGGGIHSSPFNHMPGWQAGGFHEGWEVIVLYNVQCHATGEGSCNCEQWDRHSTFTHTTATSTLPHILHPHATPPSPTIQPTSSHSLKLIWTNKQGIGECAGTGRPTHACIIHAFSRALVLCPHRLFHCPQQRRP